MEKAAQETTAETKTLSITDNEISQADYERLRRGETVEAAKSASDEKTVSDKTHDESDTSETEDKEDVSDEESNDEGNDEASEADKPKKKSGTQRRIEKLVKQRAEAEREREYWREQALKTQTQKPTEEKQAAKTPAEGEPKPDDFETATDYYRAHAKWAAREEINAAKESERQEKLKSEAETKKQTFHGKVQEFEKTHADFNEVVESVDDIPMSLAVQQAILESDDGPELMYELCKNREEYERICSLPAMQAAREIGRFETKFLKASEKQTETKQKTTKAPPPVAPISTKNSSAGKKSIYDEDISLRDYEKLRREQMRKRA